MVVRRLLTSWVALTFTLVGPVRRGRSHPVPALETGGGRAQRAAVETAEIVVALVVHRHIGEADFARGSLTSAESAGLDADTSVLLEQGRLVGIEVWGRDGGLIYADRQRPETEKQLPADKLRRSRKGHAWVDVSHGTAERGVVTVAVFLPYEAGNDGAFDGWVEVLLPRERHRCGRSTLHATA